MKPSATPITDMNPLDIGDKHEDSAAQAHETHVLELSARIEYLNSLHAMTFHHMCCNNMKLAHHSIVIEGLLKNMAEQQNMIFQLQEDMALMKLQNASRESDTDDTATEDSVEKFP